jgi:hypothetical protein
MCSAPQRQGKTVGQMTTVRDAFLKHVGDGSINLRPQIPITGQNQCRLGRRPRRIRDTGSINASAAIRASVDVTTSDAFAPPE